MHAPKLQAAHGLDIRTDVHLGELEDWVIGVAASPEPVLVILALEAELARERGAAARAIPRAARTAGALRGAARGHTFQQRRARVRRCRLPALISQGLTMINNKTR